MAGSRTMPAMSGPRPVRAPRGTTLTCRSWPTEAAFRMLQNNLDPEVAERPDDLVVYGGTGRAARSLGRVRRHLRARSPRSTTTRRCSSSRASRSGCSRTHEWAPRVLLANSNLVPEWANWAEFRRLEALGLTMYGQMTAGSWIYIGTQGILQGTYECFAEIARRRFGGIAGRHDHAHRRPRRDGRRPAAGGHDERRRGAVHRSRPGAHPSAASRPATSTRSPTRSTTRSRRCVAARDAPRRRCRSGSSATPPTLVPALLERDFPADIVTDQTSAHDPLSYVPVDLTPEAAAEMAAHRSRGARAPGRGCRWPPTARRWSASWTSGAEVFDYGNSLRAEAKLGGFERAFDYPGFLPAYIRPLFCEGKGPFRWVALSGDPADIAATDRAVIEEFPDDERLHRWIRAGRRAGRVPGAAGTDLLARLRRAPPARAALQRDGPHAASCQAPIVIGRDHLDSGSVASPYRETEAMVDGSDAIADWPLLNALVNTASGRHVGEHPPRRRRRHRPLDPRRHGVPRRRHRAGGRRSWSACS